MSKKPKKEEHWTRADRIAVTGVAVAIIGALAAVFVVPEFRLAVRLDTPPAPQPTPQKIPMFTGNVGSDVQKDAFGSFLLHYLRTIVKIDIILSDGQLNEINDGGKNTFYIDLTYKHSDGFVFGGDLYIDLSKGNNDFYFDYQLSQVQSYLKLEGSFTSDGRVSVKAYPITIENASKAT